MKKSMLFFFFILIPAICCAQPSITFDSEEHDFGTVAPVDTIKHVFEFTNTGDQDLLIQKLSSS